MTMPILQSCYCCCSSAKQLAIAGGIFSLVMSSIYLTSVFFEMTCQKEAKDQASMINTSLSVLLNKFDPISPSQTRVLAADNTHKYVGSIINPKGFSKEDLFYVNLIKITSDLSVLMSVPMLFIGIAQRKGCFMVPWIIANIFQSGANLIETIYLLGLNTTQFEPTTAFIFTTTFFLLFAHIYSILGVISLFQEYQNPSEEDEVRLHYEMGHLRNTGENGHHQESAKVNGKLPHVTITYADNLDLEESIMNVSSCNPLPSNTAGSANHCQPPKESPSTNKKSCKKAKKFSPLEAIEECSIEQSEDSHKLTSSSSNSLRSSTALQGVTFHDKKMAFSVPSSEPVSAPPTVNLKTNPLIESQQQESNKNPGTFQAFSSTAMATAKKYLLQSGFMENPSSSSVEVVTQAGSISNTTRKHSSSTLV